ncbi:MAG: sugar phosphate isomerase/epimerase [Parasporobacterium sp.]|nr:sugar phosphate isomerase/epimerase [Parasporobacterium sp.]
MFKIGTLADWFGVGIIEGIKESEKCGATGVQLYAAGEFDPRTCSEEFICKVRDTAAEHNQQIVALCCELGGYGLEKAEDNPERISYLKKCAEMAMKLDCSILTTHAGVIPEDTDDPVYQDMVKAGREIGSFLAPLGLTLAIETGPDSASALRRYIDDCGEGIGVNFDPANFVMVGADDELNAVRILADKIVHTHAKDGINNVKVAPADFYHKFAEGDLDWLQSTNICTEAPLGKGSVRWDEYLALLNETGYAGYLTIEHEIKDGASEIYEAVEFLKDKCSKLFGKQQT